MITVLLPESFRGRCSFGESKDFSPAIIYFLLHILISNVYAILFKIETALKLK